jgi:hypothetical protein
MKYVLMMIMLTLSMTVSAAFIPTSDNVWQFTDTDGTSDNAGFFLTAEAGGAVRSFGMYQFDIGSFTMHNSLQIFDSTQITNKDSVGVNWNPLTEVVSTDYGSFDATAVAGLVFGFYFEAGGVTTYSQEGFNVGSIDHFDFYDQDDTFSPFSTQVYAQDNDTPDNWVTMSISDINTSQIVGDTCTVNCTTVPEPASAFLLGAGLIGLAARRKLKVS